MLTHTHRQTACGFSMICWAAAVVCLAAACLSRMPLCWRAPELGQDPAATLASAQAATLHMHVLQRRHLLAHGVHCKASDLTVLCRRTRMMSPSVMWNLPLLQEPSPDAGGVWSAGAPQSGAGVWLRQVRTAQGWHWGMCAGLPQPGAGLWLQQALYCVCRAAAAI